jgi:alpha-beta hydrolase superfamily lysophospholipase
VPTRSQNSIRSRLPEAEARSLSDGARCPEVPFGTGDGSLIEPEIGRFTASDGYRLHFRHWRPNCVRPRGYVVALHGIQSHSGWYLHSSSRLCELGFDVRFLDRRGSGLNEAERGHAAHHDRLVNDVISFLADTRYEARGKSPASAVILLSVSWGGKLAVATAARRPELIDALALLYPGICARFAVRPFQRMGLWLADRLGVSRRLCPIPLDDPTLFTGQPCWQQFLREDTLALHRASVGFLKASLALDREASLAPARIVSPVLLMLAGKDRITDNQATIRYFNRLASSDRTLFEYPEAEHTLEFEPDREKFIADLCDWVESIVPIRTAS